MKVGVLALQGAFIEHIKALEYLGVNCVEIRKKEDIIGVDRIVLPGGESTVQGKLLHLTGLFDITRELINEGMPTLATCAGLILLASNLSNDENIYLGTLPVTVKRNAFGRQLGSYEERGKVLGYEDYPMVFIRAPYIESTSEDVKTIAASKGHIVGVEYKSQIALSFHPELTNDLRIHRHFLSL